MVPHHNVEDLITQVRFIWQELTWVKSQKKSFLYSLMHLVTCGKNHGGVQTKIGNTNELRKTKTTSR